MNPKVLPKEAWTVVRKLTSANVLEGWLLAGGTGLALQLGHRVSIDLDFFREGALDTHGLRSALAGQGRLEVQAQDADTLHVRLEDVRLTFLRAEAPFLFPPVPYRGLSVADIRDIAALKVVAVGGRGSRKDFVDLYAYLEAGGDLRSLMGLLHRKYVGTTFNEMHLLRSLIYFDDAEQEPMPRMIQDISWKEVRARLEAEARLWAP
jgi:hypothetical protein